MSTLATQKKHLSKDSVLKTVIDNTGNIALRRDPDLYLALLRAVVGQQLSVKAAGTIWERFLGLFRDRYPHPRSIRRLSDEKLRSVGLSFQKAGYVRNIADFALNKTFDHKQLKAMNDEELIEYLVQIKGVGRWTVEMVLMFNLGREDIFPKDDLGIQTGMRALYGLNSGTRRELHREMELLSEQWRPYRTLACMYLWRHKDSLVTKKKP